jgi:manganese oxidase
MITRILPAALLVALVACSAPAGASPAATEPSPVTADLTVDLADFMIDPSDVEADGPMVTIEVTNEGPTPHNLTIRDAAGEVLMATEDLRRGESQTISGELAPGTYTIFCSFAGHESLGMSGTLTVSDS